MSKKRGNPATAPSPPADGSSGLIIRHRLLDALAVSPRPRLIVVQAPAGYGKTSLLRQHCERRAALGEKIAWVRMDAQSADAAQFLRLLCDAAEALSSPPGRETLPAGQRPASLQELLRSLARIAKPVVLVVDNFETAAAPDFEAVFAQVVRSLPETVQLCVGTRVLPTARLARLQIRDRTVIISNEELCFRPAETLAFFAEFSGLKPAEIAQIHARTDGWPAALQAFRLSLRRGGCFRAEAWTGKGVTRELMDFLAAEMFDNLEPALGSLLLELAIPEKLSPGLVEDITGEARGEQRLAEIEHTGLFLAQADLEGIWFRFHNLFRHFLLTRGRSVFSAAELEARHRRIARWYVDHGMAEEAIGHWIEGHDTGTAADTFATIIDRLVAQERLGLVESYADRLPLEAMLRHENLVRGAVASYGFRRAFDKAELLLDRQREMLEASGAVGDAIGRHNFSRLFVLAAQDRIEEMGAVALETGEQLSDRSGLYFGVSLNARAMLCIGRGEFEEARSLMLQALPLHDRAGSLFGRAYRDAIYSMSLSGQGRIDDAVRALEEALRQNEQRSFGSVTAGAVTAAYLASNLYEQGRIEEASALIRDYAPLVDQQTIVDAVGAMSLTRARIAFGGGQRGDAEEALERMIYLGYRHALPRLVVYGHAELARQATLDDELGRAERWLNELPAEYRGEPRNGLIFHAGETEACTITWARWLIRVGRHAEARAILATELRRAVASNRHRRALKLRLMNALALAAAGKANIAGRSMLEALEIGAKGGFLRSFLDEGEPAVILLRQLRTRQNLPQTGRPDPVIAFLDRLIDTAGGAASEAHPRTDATDSDDPIDRLTSRERSLLLFVASGLSNAALADRLSVSINTVKWHMRNIFEKLRVENRVQAIALARQHGLID